MVHIIINLLKVHPVARYLMKPSYIRALTTKFRTYLLKIGLTSYLYPIQVAVRLYDH